MFIIDYLYQWWILRPRNLKQATKEDYTLFEVKETYTEICKILNIKKKLRVYVTGKICRLYECCTGRHKNNKFNPVIFIANTGTEMIYNIAHEMFHEYQYENYGKNFYKISEEEREIEACGFAVAYCEYRWQRKHSKSENEYLPDKIRHISFSDETDKERTEDDKMPKRVREFANFCRDKFNIVKYTDKYFLEENIDNC